MPKDGFPPGLVAGQCRPERLANPGPEPRPGGTNPYDSLEFTAETRKYILRMRLWRDMLMLGLNSGCHIHPLPASASMTTEWAVARSEQGKVASSSWNWAAVRMKRTF